MSKDIPFRSIRTSQSSFAVRSATQPMQMHKKPLHGHVQAYQLEVKIVLIYSLRERWEVAHKLGFDERSWDWLKLSEENNTSDFSEIGKYSESIFRCIQQRMEVICTKSPPPKKTKTKKTTRWKISAPEALAKAEQMKKLLNDPRSHCAKLMTNNVPSSDIKKVHRQDPLRDELINPEPHLTIDI